MHTSGCQGPSATGQLSAYINAISSLLRLLMLRHKATDKFFGEDIVKLPPMDIRLCALCRTTTSPTSTALPGPQRQRRGIG
jgi:hypothetical protein